MNALVSMHGIWLLVLVPFAAVVAWRWSSPRLRKIVLYAMSLASVVLIGWFGYHAVFGPESSTSLYNRVMHATDVATVSVNFPILQFLIATVVFVVWPRRLQFRPADVVADSDPQE